MQYAIVTKYLGPTNTKDARVKATLPNGKSVTVSWNHELYASDVHVKAAKECVERHIISEQAWLKDKAAWVSNTMEVYGNKSGFVCIVTLVNKDQEI